MILQMFPSKVQPVIDTSGKPIVLYYAKDGLMICSLFNPTTEKMCYVAHLHALEHYRLGNGAIRTSEVVSFNTNTGVVETLNTVYIPHND